MSDCLEHQYFLLRANRTLRMSPQSSRQLSIMLLLLSVLVPEHCVLLRVRKVESIGPEQISTAMQGHTRSETERKACKADLRWKLGCGSCVALPDFLSRTCSKVRPKHRACSPQGRNTNRVQTPRSSVNRSSGPPAQSTHLRRNTISCPNQAHPSPTV